MKVEKEQLRLYAVTDRMWLKEEETLAEKVEQAIQGGVTFVQLREKDPVVDVEALARSVQEVCRRYRVPFIINDDVALAKRVDADGVHLGASDMEVKAAREILGPDKIIGATAKTVAQAQNAALAGADYLGSGAVFGSTTKKDAIPMTKELLQEITQSVEIPVVAIGGIEASNVAELKGIDIAGVAVVSGIFAQQDVKAAAEQLIRNLFG